VIFQQTVSEDVKHLKPIERRRRYARNSIRSGIIDRVTVKREQLTACNAMIALLSQAWTLRSVSLSTRAVKTGETATNETGRMVQFAVRES
jgi:hypothetical protein